MSPIVEAVTQPVWLGEGPHWDAAEQALYFVSIFDRTIHRYHPQTNSHTKSKLVLCTGLRKNLYTSPRSQKYAVAKGKDPVWTTETMNDGSMPTFIIPIEGRPHHFAVGLDRRVVAVRWAGEEGGARVGRTIAEVDRHSPDNRLNDAKADPRGRLFAGTMGHEYEPGKFHPKKGSLYRIEPDGRVLTLESNIDISNGMCWDVQRKAFFYADSFEYTIRRYDYDIETGDISNPQHVFKYSDHGLTGIVDGMTIDTDGNLWVANFDNRQVLKIDPVASSILQKIPIPALQVTSCTWGGTLLDELYVTTASMDRGTPQTPPCGATFKVTGLGAKGHLNQSVKFDNNVLGS